MVTVIANWILRLWLWFSEQTWQLNIWPSFRICESSWIMKTVGRILMCIAERISDILCQYCRILTVGYQSRLKKGVLYENILQSRLWVADSSLGQAKKRITSRLSLTECDSWITTLISWYARDCIYPFPLKSWFLRSTLPTRFRKQYQEFHWQHSYAQYKL